MPLLMERLGDIAVLTLSRPHARNAWGDDFNDGLISILPQLEADRDVRCVILTGDEKGKAFSSGAYLADKHTHAALEPGQFIEDLPNSRKFVSNLLSEFPKPIIAAVNGYAIGIGCIASASCDLVVASEKAEWRLPQVQLGILPAYAGAARLARLIGKGNAMRVAMGFPLDAREAHRTGLAQWLVPHEDLMDHAMEVARTIAASAPLATRLVKESIDRGMDLPNIADAALVDAYRFMVLQQTEDAKEAHDAWRDGRRKPEFAGR
ncbi:enoyl-CoA hydratase/isomerase family protein [Verticiella sediminum]|nr:enoyl-CoA hydratase/isomerase family protein [Verticiella sediminum]